MSIIEQAAARIAQLKKVGVDIGMTEAPEQVLAPPPVPQSQPDHAAARAPASDPVVDEAPSASVATLPDPDVSSRRVELDLKRLDEMRIVTPRSPRSQIAEEFRMIKRPILANARGVYEGEHPQTAKPFADIWIGALIFGVVQQGLFFAGVESSLFRVFLGVILLFAVILNTYIRRIITGER